MEAALSGVYTLMVDPDMVEASKFFPTTHRFLPSADGLADAIGHLATHPWGLERLGTALREAIAPEVSEAHFERDTLTAWAHFSHAARRGDA